MAPNAASAASIPVRMALWLPLMRGRLTKPADQRAARKGELRHRLKATLADRARAVTDAAPALQHRANERVRLEALEFVERRKIRVRVIEMDRKAVGREIVAVMIDKGSASRVIVERPAHAVHDKTRAVFCLRQLP